MASFVDPRVSQRAYEHWEHAQAVVRVASTEFQRIDVITTLKRAVDHRNRAIHDLYKLREVPLSNLPKNSIERLQFFGVIRPLMVEKLLALRNAIEHEDASPPPLAECEALVEFVWYFLRSTDRLVTLTRDTYELHHPDGMQEVGGTIYSGPEHQWITTVSLFLPCRMVSLTPSDDWVRIAPHQHRFAHNPSLAAVEERELEKQLGPRRDNQPHPDGEHFSVCGKILGPLNHLRTAIQLLISP